MATYERLFDGLLSQSGFKRRRQVWNRRVNNYVDVISIQKSKSIEEFTVNFGVCDLEIYSACWLKNAPEFIDDSVCVFRARIGDIIGNKDTWWSINDVEAAPEIMEIVRTNGLNILDNFHSHQKMIEYLKDIIKNKRGYPLPVIYLSLLLIQDGHQSEGISLLKKCMAKTSVPWKERIDKIILKLLDESDLFTLETI